MVAAGAGNGQCGGQADGRQAALREGARDWLARLAEKPDLTVHALQESLMKAVSWCDATRCRFLKRHCISSKKKAVFATEQDRPDI